MNIKGLHEKPHASPYFLLQQKPLLCCAQQISVCSWLLVFSPTEPGLRRSSPDWVTAVDQPSFQQNVLQRLTVCGGPFDALAP
jgi:hypothetical protein